MGWRQGKSGILIAVRNNSPIVTKISSEAPSLQIHTPPPTEHHQQRDRTSSEQKINERVADYTSEKYPVHKTPFSTFLIC